MRYFPHLFAPGQVGRRVLRNRILMAPMEKNLGTAEGAVTQRYIDYCEARAAGGVALILLESMYVDPAGKNHRYQLGLHDDALIPGYRRLVEVCHRHGALVGVELQFAGRETSSVITGVQPVAPSPVPCRVLAGGETPRALTVPEIRALVGKFAEAAHRAVTAGFDVVELHGAHGYLIAQFLSPYANRREDDYGGDFARRLRFPLEVIAAVREAIGAEVPLLYRLSAVEHVEGGLTLEDTCRIVPHLEAAGVDLLDVSAGIYESAVWIAQPMEMPQGCLAPLSREIRRCVRVPVSVAGRITDASVAERILEAGDADFVTLGRALHADPEMPRKSLEGRLNEICHCVACLKCSDLLGQNLPVLCLANTHTAREREYRVRPTSRPQRIVVVGAGPAEELGGGVGRWRRPVGGKGHDLGPAQDRHPHGLGEPEVVTDQEADAGLRRGGHHLQVIPRGGEPVDPLGRQVRLAVAQRDALGAHQHRRVVHLLAHALDHPNDGPGAQPPAVRL